MAFSFIRKKFTPDVPAHLPAMKGNGSTNTPAAEPDLSLTQLSIEVVDNKSQLTPIQEEAAMLHSSGQSDLALQLLQTEIRKISGLRQTETWLMLFELLQQHNDKFLFDEIALQFVLEFEKTPPAWREVSEQKNSEQSNYYLFSAVLNGHQIDQEIASFEAACKNHHHLRIDLARVTQIDTIAAAELLALWQRCAKNKIRLQLLGRAEIESLLRKRIKTGRAIPAEAPLWLLLIELQQIQGLQNEFENLAIDYAITFEVSPPSWIPIDSLPDLPPLANVNLSASASDRLFIQGDLLHTKPEQLAIIRDFVSLHNFPVLDFHAVHRLDFDSAGQLLGLCMENPQQITFCNVNALILALFRIMGITELAVLSLA
ncbi:STAS domain-containing protein [Iodobacter ciconiae]|uniref:STAS domain-containing protein n=1 Tax=Iodobacter ciconiae TaxID=2496266 RepID=A0A3S8ZP50_9NEIS|nr:STAS domain-containing protein [Iodobacter ciconiae]AZN35230.1 hypothetical protein EJO50_01240 [Iodobacter ciconiae]